MTRINETHTGWWCPACGCDHNEEVKQWPVDLSEEFKIGERFACPKLDGLPDDERWALQIPVFTPLATPEVSTETREDMEAHAEVVCRSSPSVGFYTLTRASAKYDENGYVVEGERHSMLAPSTELRADAVLYVVEGKLGGAE